MGKKGKSRIFLSRKSQSSMTNFTMIELFVVLAVSAIYLLYLASLAKNTYFERTYMSKDHALLIGTIYGNPGYLSYNYNNPNINLKNFDFYFTENSVKTSESGSEGRLFSEEPFARDLNLSYQQKIIRNSDNIIFEKNSNSLEIKN